MILRWLEFEGFRNLQSGRIEFGPGVNLFWGENGAGKSNLLEAVYYLLTTRSFRTQSWTRLVAQGAERFRLAGRLEGRTGWCHLEASQGGGRGRSIALDGKPVGLEEVLRRCSILAFSSHQMELFRGGPRDRRRFLDRGILALRPAYLRDLGEFFRTLTQRNRLLKSSAGSEEQAAWDERFVVAAARVAAARHGFTARLAAEVDRCAGALLPAGTRLGLEYRPHPPAVAGEGDGSAAAFARTLGQRLERSADAERRMGHSLFGPHRDDLRIFAGGRDLLHYGSAGQQRAALLALKLTRLELYREQRGEAPLLLVDDMDSDLDDGTSDRLIARLAGTQTLVSTCKRGGLERHGSLARVFRVQNGSIIPGEGAIPAVPVGQSHTLDGAL